MLARYKIYRGKRPDGDPMPDGVRQDTRKHTRHCLRPSAEIVSGFLDAPSADAWDRLATDYEALIEARFREDPEPFRELAALARSTDVFLGCNCPTKKNPDPTRCHTILALRFMKQKFPELPVRESV